MNMHGQSRLESLQIACPRFQKFTTNYIRNIKTACPRSRLQDTNFPDLWSVVTRTVTSDSTI